MIFTQYPVVMKRKRTGQIVINSLFLFFSLVMTVYGISDGSSVTLYAVASAVFALSLGFNIFLACEKTLVVEKDKIYTASVFMPELSVETKDLRGVELSEANGGELRINYDLPEYNVRSILGDIELSDSSHEGLWNYTVCKKDVNMPLSEVKFIINNLIITRDSTVT